MVPYTHKSIPSQPSTPPFATTEWDGSWSLDHPYQANPEIEKFLKIVSL